MYKQQDLLRKNSKICKGSSVSIREKAENYGIAILEPSELIALVTGIKLDEVKKIVGVYRSVKNTLAAMEGNRSIRNIKAAAVLKLAQIAFTEDIEHTILNSPEQAGNFCVGKLAHLPYEVFCILCLDSQNRILRFEEVSRGTVNEALVSPRDVLSFAIEKNSRCTGLILAHVHPGGSLQPSTQDIDATKRIKAAAEVFGIKVLDHIIVADNKFVSFAEKGLMQGGGVCDGEA